MPVAIVDITIADAATAVMLIAASSGGNTFT
jgi:hypothetical protein